MNSSFADHAGDEQDGIERANDRAEESLREQQWTEFIEDIGCHIKLRSLRDVLTAAGAAYEGDYFICHAAQQTMITFADSEGWHGVLRAIAHALQDEANARAKAEVSETQKGVSQ